MGKFDEQPWGDSLSGVSVAQLPFPLLARQLSLVGALTIGLPGFLLALEPNQTRPASGFVRRVLITALPAGIVAATATFAAYADARTDGATLAQSRTTACVVLFVVAAALLAEVARPWRPRRVAVLASMILLFLACLTLPATARYFDIAAPPRRTWFTSGVLAAGAGALVWFGRRMLALRLRPGAGLGPRWRRINARAVER